VKRGGFKRNVYAPPRAPLIVPTVKPIVRAVMATAANAPEFVPAPKFEYVRDERFQAMCRAMPCQNCGAEGPDAGVTWAHSNQGIHGHAKGIKASDEFCAALCASCHRELDQGKKDDRAGKVSMWARAYRRTVQLAVSLGLWPAGFPVPEFNNQS
jgi:cytochrome c553